MVDSCPVAGGASAPFLAGSEPPRMTAWSIKRSVNYLQFTSVLQAVAWSSQEQLFKSSHHCTGGTGKHCRHPFLGHQSLQCPHWVGCETLSLWYQFKWFIFFNLVCAYFSVTCAVNCCFPGMLLISDFVYILWNSPLFIGFQWVLSIAQVCADHLHRS